MSSRITQHVERYLSDHKQLVTFTVARRNKGVAAFTANVNQDYPCPHAQLGCCKGCYFGDADQKKFEHEVALMIGLISVEMGTLISYFENCTNFDCVGDRLLHFCNSPVFIVSTTDFMRQNRDEGILISILWSEMQEAAIRSIDWTDEYIRTSKKGNNILERVGRYITTGKDISRSKASISCKDSCAGFTFLESVVYQDRNRFATTVGNPIKSRARQQPRGRQSSVSESNDRMREMRLGGPIHNSPERMTPQEAVQDGHYAELRHAPTRVHRRPPIVTRFAHTSPEVIGSPATPASRNNTGNRSLDSMSSVGYQAQGHRPRPILRQQTGRPPRRRSVSSDVQEPRVRRTSTNNDANSVRSFLVPQQTGTFMPTILAEPLVPSRTGAALDFLAGDQADRV
jgi:hypothetical protein